jgi:DNA-binding transcriptional LysR family regulator
VTPILTELDAARDELSTEGHSLRGTVRIALPGTLATEGLLARLRMLLDEHPRLAVQTRVTNTPINIAAEGIDIAIVVGQPAQTSFVGRLLGRPSWVLAASPAYLQRRGRPRTPRDLGAHRCLRFLSSPAQDEWVLVDRQGNEVTVPVSGDFEADDSRALGDATYAGVGIGIRPAGECARAQKSKRLERVLPAYRFQPLDVYALLPKGRVRIPRVAACLEALRAAVAEVS